jgi:protein CWC15
VSHNSKTANDSSQPGQAAPEDLRNIDLLEELEQREDGDFGKKRLGDEQEPRQKRLRVSEPSIESVEFALDETVEKDDASTTHSESDSGSSSDDSDSGEDETEALMRELEKIKRERAEERERKEIEEREKLAKEREDEIISGNPLLEFGAKPDFTVKRRWDDDVVFKNQAKGVEDIPKKQFINDMLRSSFHKKFMDKYVR